MCGFEYCNLHLGFFYVLKEVSYAQQGCIYLIQNTVKKKKQQ